MANNAKYRNYRYMNVCVAPGSHAERTCRARVQAAREAARPEEIAPGLPQSQDHDLVYRGGHLIPDLTFTNFYVGGPESWDAGDIQSIDGALAAAMSDKDLNNVIVQYFQDRVAITSTFRPSSILPGPAPQSVSQGDVEALVRSLHAQGTLNGFNFPSTVFNFMLPRGTILTDDAHPTGQSVGGQGRGTGSSSVARAVRQDIPVEDESSSLEGLGGYHGSIDLDDGHGGNLRIYYAVGVFSETRGNGTTNGIPVFDRPWKNVVATFYHELNEARTDPDVEEANKTNDDGLVGWTSNQGEECGDFPITEAGNLGDLGKVFREVKLTNQGETVPIQFQYSNVDHGPAGPTTQPERLARV